MSISVVFNNGESRVIDFRKVLRSIGTDEQSPARILYQPEEFCRVRLNNNTLSWDQVDQYITMKNNTKQRVPFEIGADVLLKHSVAEGVDRSLQIGKMVRGTRKKSGMTQRELAIRSGTTRNYISRIENDRSDIELGTLRRIIEIGLGKHLEIQIK